MIRLKFDFVLSSLFISLIPSLCLAYEMGFNCGGDLGAERVYTTQDGKRYEKD